MPAPSEAEGSGAKNPSESSLNDKPVAKSPSNPCPSSFLSRLGVIQPALSEAEGSEAKNPSQSFGNKKEVAKNPSESFTNEKTEAKRPAGQNTRRGSSLRSE